jgi:uncharacterized protein YjeT (DUF2065 family)
MTRRYSKGQALNITVSEGPISRDKNINPDFVLGGYIMDNVIKALGVIIVGMAVVYILKPDILKRVLKFFSQGRRIYFIAAIRFLLAIIFLLGARECDFPRVIFAFAVLFILSGSLILLLGPEKIRSMLTWYQDRPVGILRVLGLVALIFGAAIIYSA